MILAPLCSALTVNELIPNSYIFENNDQEPEFLVALDEELAIALQLARNLSGHEDRPEKLLRASMVLFIKYRRLKQLEYLN